MAFHLIDLDTWDRREYYLHYMQEMVCTYSMNVRLDITPLQGEKLYPAMLWLLTDTANQFEQFRTQLTPEGLGVFDTLTPSYTIFNREKETFSVIWTEFSPDYREFFRRYQADVEKYKTAGGFYPKPERPAGCFDVSMVPWLSFTALNINVYDAGRHLLPVFTMGKAERQEERTLLPLAIQVHHAVCDGYHVSRFVQTLQEKINAFGAGR